MKIPLLPLTLLAAGCASLPDGSVKSVNEYAKLSSAYTEYPVKVVQQCVDLKYEIDLVYAGTFDKDVLYEKLENSYQGKQQALANAEKLEQSLRILDEYARALAALSSPDLGKNVEKSTESLGTNIEALIATYNRLPDSLNRISPGVGTLLAAAVRRAGGRQVRSQQVKCLREYLTQGDALVNTVTKSIQQELWTQVLQQWVPGFKRNLRANQRLLLSRLPATNAWYANEYALKIAALIERIDKTEALAKEALLSAQQLPVAHRALVQELNRKQTNAESLREIQNLYNSVRELTDLYKKLNG